MLNKNIDEICSEIKNIQNEKRTEYCLRLQKAFEYKGSNDHEDIPSILKDYEDLIMNRYYKDSVVLTLEELKSIKNNEFRRGKTQQCWDVKNKSRKTTIDEIISFVEEKDKKAGKYSIYSKLLQELKEKFKCENNE